MDHSHHGGAPATLPPASPEVDECDGYTHRVALGPSMILYWSLEIDPSDGTTEVFSAKVRYLESFGWFGVSVNDRPQMVGGDAVVGEPGIGVQQRHLTSRSERGGENEVAEMSTLLDSRLGEEDGYTTMWFSRPLRVPESANGMMGKEIFAEGDNLFQWAHSSCCSSGFGYHAHAGLMTLSFPDQGACLSSLAQQGTGGEGSADSPSAWYSCSGGSVMRNGFAPAFQGGACVLWLFQSAVADTAARYLGFLLLAFALGVVVEFVRMASSGQLPALRDRVFIRSLLYGLQLTLGYSLMLTVMLYEPVYFAAAVLGLVVGKYAASRAVADDHATRERRKSRKNAEAPGGQTKQQEEGEEKEEESGSRGQGAPATAAPSAPCCQQQRHEEQKLLQAEETMRNEMS
jgi:hypothetical protein